MIVFNYDFSDRRFAYFAFKLLIEILSIFGMISLNKIEINPTFKTEEMDILATTFTFTMIDE
jgi:hypothetical protein